MAKPYDGDVHGAFVSAAAATMRHFRHKGLGVVAAYTQKDEVTFLCAGPAVLAGGASDPSRRLVTLFASVLSKRFEQALRPTKPRPPPRPSSRRASLPRRRGPPASWRSSGAASTNEATPRRRRCGTCTASRVQQELPPVDEALLAALTAGAVPEVRAEGGP